MWLVLWSFCVTNQLRNLFSPLLNSRLSLYARWREERRGEGSKKNKQVMVPAFKEFNGGERHAEILIAQWVLLSTVGLWTSVRTQCLQMLKPTQFSPVPNRGIPHDTSSVYFVSKILFSFSFSLMPICARQKTKLCKANY